MASVKRWLRSRGPLARAGNKADPIGDFSRFGHGMLNDNSVQAALVDVGFARVRDVVPNTVIQDLSELYEGAISKYRQPLPEHWFPTGMLKAPELQAELHDGAQRLVAPVLETILSPRKAQVFTGSFAVKPSGKASFLGHHQDASIVDETKTASINFWIPLTKSHPGNGPLSFVAGSHRFGNVQRSLSFPWAFEGLDQTMERHASVLTAEVGDLVLFDTAVIHGSQANLTSETRIALQGAIVPTGLEMEHLRVGDDTPEGMVEVRYATPMDLLTSDGVEVLNSAIPKLRRRVPCEASAETFEQWCIEGKASLVC